MATKSREAFPFPAFTASLAFCNPFFKNAVCRWSNVWQMDLYLYCIQSWKFQNRSHSLFIFAD